MGTTVNRTEPFANRTTTRRYDSSEQNADMGFKNVQMVQVHFGVLSVYMQWQSTQTTTNKKLYNSNNIIPGELAFVAK